MRRISMMGVCLCVGLIATSVRGADPRADFLKLIDRPKVPPNLQLRAIENDADGAFSLSFSNQASDSVSGKLIKPATASGRLPAVILLHGTGGFAGDMLPLMRKFAAAGFVAIAIDGPHHGSRIPRAQQAANGKGSTAYFSAIAKAFQDPSHAPGQARPFYFDTVWDVMRLVDCMQEMDFVDPNRIGLMGISKGGIETYLTAAVDPRIAAAVPCIAVQSFKWALENDKWQPRIGTIQAAFDASARFAKVEKPDAAFVKTFYDRIAPGIDGEFDGPSMLPLIAPRPLMTINGETDDRTPLPGLKLCTDAALAAYRTAGAEDRLKVVIEPRTGHKVNPDAEQEAIEFLGRWLNASPATKAAGAVN